MSTINRILSTSSILLRLLHIGNEDFEGGNKGSLMKAWSFAVVRRPDRGSDSDLELASIIMTAYAIPSQWAKTLNCIVPRNELTTLPFSYF